MPTSARKSSVGGARRGPQKAHIPYRGDNPEVGKKTGIAVQHVERKSDGFEPFEEIMSQADKRTPPKVKGRKKKPPVPSPLVEEDDENGEMSMDLDNSNANSPMEYFTKSRQPVTQSGLNRVGSSSRPVMRSSVVDFDKVPSPRPLSSKRQSMANGSVAGPSNLSHSIAARDLDPEPDDDDDDDDDGPDQSGMGGNFDDYGDQDNISPDVGRTSFVEMDQDDDDDDDEQAQEIELPGMESPLNGKKDKGKGRAIQREEPEEQELEPEITQGLDDVEHGHQSDGDEEEEPVSKKAKVADEKPKRGKPAGRPKGKANKPEERRSVTPDGVRRGKRFRYPPLEWWRQEKVVYGRRESGIVLVPHIKEVRRIPLETPPPLGTNKRKRARTRQRSKSKAEDDERVVVLNPEEGWDDDTPQQSVIVDYLTRGEVQRRIAMTAKMVDPKAVANGDWFFHKIFGDADFIAAGQLIIPPKSRKPSKMTKDNTYIFYVIEGAINLRVHETSLILASGGMFMVPRGNTYFIENIADRDAKLFFTQARKVPLEEMPQPPGSHIQPVPERSSESQQRKAVEGRPSSGPPAGGRAASKAAPGKRAATTKI